MSEVEKVGPIAHGEFVSALGVITRALPDDLMGGTLDTIMAGLSEYDQREIKSEIRRQELPWHNAYPRDVNPYTRMMSWLEPTDPRDLHGS